MVELRDGFMGIFFVVVFVVATGFFGWKILGDKGKGKKK
jgi:hypothetical protein